MNATLKGGLTLAHDLMLLSLDPETGAKRKTTQVQYGLVGALLAELALAGRVEIVGHRVDVVDATSTGRRRADDLLMELANRKPMKAADVVGKWYRKVHEPILEDLVAGEVVSERKERMLGLVPVKRYPQITGTFRDELLAPLRGIMVDRIAPEDPRIVALGHLVIAADLHGVVFPGEPKRALVKRLKEMDEAGWATKAVMDALAAAAGGAVAAGAAVASS